MKLIIEKFVIKSFEYNGINELDSAYNKLKHKNDFPKEVEIEQRIDTNNQFALKVNNDGLLIITEARKISSTKEVGIELESASINTNIFIDFHFIDSLEKKKFNSFAEKEIISLINPFLEPIIQMYINNIFDYISSNGVLKSDNFRQNSIQFEINM